MVHGGVYKEKVALSEATCYSGEPSAENTKKDAFKEIDKMRDALHKKDYKKAQTLHEGAYGNKLNYGTNLPIGNLILNFDHDGWPYTNYTRDLRLDTATASIDYDIGDTHYKREIFTSNPHQIMVMRITSSKKGGLNFDAQLDGGDCPFGFLGDETGDLILTGNAYENLQSNGKTGVD